MNIKRNNGRTTHGLRGHILYDVWSNMKKRCYTKKNYNYRRYGMRGIQMCEEWKHSPTEFIKWCERNGHKEGLQIDRINNDIGYSPENCRFVTNKVNCRNQSRSKWWHINGVRYESAQQAASAIGMSASGISQWCYGFESKGKRYPPKPNCYSELKYP